MKTTAFYVFVFLMMSICLCTPILKNDLCQFCTCDDKGTATCSDPAVINYLPQIAINVSILILNFNNSTVSAAVLPWHKFATIPRLKILNLTSLQLSCACENAWLSFTSDMGRWNVNETLIPWDMKYFYNKSKDCEHSYCQTFSTSAIFKLPKIVLLPEDPFQICLSGSAELFTAKQYFTDKCGLNMLSIETQKTFISNVSVTSFASCSTASNRENESSNDFVSLDFVPLFSENTNMPVIDFNREYYLTFHGPPNCILNVRNFVFRHLHNVQYSSISNNLKNGWLVCTNVNSYLPRSVIAPVYAETSPKIVSQKTDKDSPYNIMFIFLIHAYPRPGITLINPANKFIVETSLNRGVLEVTESPIAYGHSVNVIVKFVAVLMNCFSGTYRIKACNKLGCAKAEFSVGNGMPDGMCGEYEPDLLSNKSEIHEPLVDEPDTKKPPGAAYERDSWIYIAVPFIVVFAVVFVGILTTWLFMHMIGWRRDNAAMGARPTRSRPSLVDWELSPLATSKNMDHNVTYVDWLDSIKTKVKVYPSEQLEVMKELGEGAFGRVYLTKNKFPNLANETLDHNYTNIHPAEQYCAMKVLKFVTSEKLEDLEREVQIMSTLEHPNVVRFYGISFKSGTLALLFECMEHGDLVNYLRNNSPENPKCETPLRCTNLLDISRQVARGLEYLAGQHLVHRDLAARNCLVGKDLAVKISDFGMTRDIYITDYYKMGAHTLVPLRWLPPESIIYRKFTTESDIWSFGVLLWEIFTYGKIPWYMYSNSEVLQIIQDGKLLDQPTDCPSEVYTLMTGCWLKIPSERLSAHKVLTKLEEIIENRLRYCNVLENGSEQSLDTSTLKPNVEKD